MSRPQVSKGRGDDSDDEGGGGGDEALPAVWQAADVHDWVRAVKQRTSAARATGKITMSFPGGLTIAVKVGTRERVEEGLGQISGPGRVGGSRAGVRGGVCGRCWSGWQIPGRGIACSRLAVSACGFWHPPSAHLQLLAMHRRCHHLCLPPQSPSCALTLPPAAPSPSSPSPRSSRCCGRRRSPTRST